MVINKHMRNRELINRKLENLESNLAKMNFMLKRQSSIEEFNVIVENSRELIETIKSFVSMEPMSPNEINKI